MTMHNPIVIIFSFLLCTTAIKAQDVAYLVKEAEDLEKSFKEEDALKKVQEALKLAPNDLAALSKASILSSQVGNRQKEDKRKAEYFTAAKTYAESALKVDPKDAVANFAMGMAMGRMALISSGKEKIQSVRDIKKYAEAALAAKPDFAKAQHLLGKWHYEVTSLNFVEKGLVKVIFGGLPDASMPQAIQWYEKARAQDPGFVLNYLELARAYKENGQSDKAIDILNRMARLPPKMQDDPAYKAEGKKMLDSLL
jgi:tetratricopeptide (TPR) repeat protein